MEQNVFQRYEKKYLLKKEEYLTIRQRLEPFMEEDAYGWHNIRNIYYDTRDYALIRTSIEKPKYKEKFRIRCYGAPTPESSYYLEIKKKYNGVVYKRRIPVSSQEMQAYMNQGAAPDNDGQIFSEIDYFLHFYQVEPKVYISYDRVALYGREDESFRVTFDHRIRSRYENLTLADDENTRPLLGSGYYLMEVKISQSMPLWFARILSDMELYSTNFSKYGNVYRREELSIC